MNWRNLFKSSHTLWLGANMPKKRCMKRHPVTQPSDPSYRLIPLTKGQNAIVDTADFEWLSQWNWHVDFDPERNSYYALRNARRANGKRYRISMHRAIAKSKRKQETDHRNHNGLDNRRKNLRTCTKIQNMCNLRKRTDNLSGFKGVSIYRDKERWIGQIQVGKNKKYLGLFATPEEAARAYDIAARKLHGEFAFLNFPTP